MRELFSNEKPTATRWKNVKDKNNRISSVFVWECFILISNSHYPCIHWVAFKLLFYVYYSFSYLKNSCENENCLLSHDLIPQKVPVCLHFLNGNCEASQCPFLHVKLDSKSPICVQFLRGYCEAADKVIRLEIIFIWMFLLSVG